MLQKDISVKIPSWVSYQMSSDVGDIPKYSGSFYYFYNQEVLVLLYIFQQKEKNITMK